MQHDHQRELASPGTSRLTQREAALVIADAQKPVVIAGILLDVSFRDGIKEETARAYGEDLTR